MQFDRVLTQFTSAVENGNGAQLAQLFTADGVYHDGFYGSFQGHAAIADMLETHFWGKAKDFKWQMQEPIMTGSIGYARYLFSYTSTLPEAKGQLVMFDGMSRFQFEGALIKDYVEIFDAAMALAQTGFSAERIAKFADRKAQRLRASDAAKQHLNLVEER